jgi:hypothetical protein
MSQPYEPLRPVTGIALPFKLERKRSLGRRRSRWVDNIKMAVREIIWARMTGLIWLRIGTSGELL